MSEVSENKIWAYFMSPQPETRIIKRSTDVRKAKGHEVWSFLELATKVADLQFLNRDLVLMFRGQGEDYGSMQGNTSLKDESVPLGAGQAPADGRAGVSGAIQPSATGSGEAGGALSGAERLQRYRILRWASIQSR